jgi:hypothetical protein
MSLQTNSYIKIYYCSITFYKFWQNIYIFSIELSNTFQKNISLHHKFTKLHKFIQNSHEFYVMVNMNDIFMYSMF